MGNLKRDEGLSRHGVGWEGVARWRLSGVGSQRPVERNAVENLLVKFHVRAGVL